MLKQRSNLKNTHADNETMHMRACGMANANARLGDPTLSPEERAKWERIQKIVGGDSLAEIYPDLPSQERCCRLIES